MAFHLEDIVPWGRSFAEYQRMFSLTDADLRRRILGCADGPADFNAELRSRGRSAVSCDPLYRFPADAIRRRIDEVLPLMTDQARRNPNQFVWSAAIPNAEALGQLRMDAMSRFLADYGSGVTAARYIAGELPRLPFADATFDLALCSHFLFLYAEQLSLAFHLESLRELLRVAHEVRIFPLLELSGKQTRHLPAATTALARDGYLVRIVNVDYEFQRGGNRMLRICRR